MSKDILGMYGPDVRDHGRTSNGGKMEPKPLEYCPPVGPKGQMEKGPGLHGTNHGCCGTQGKR